MSEFEDVLRYRKNDRCVVVGSKCKKEDGEIAVHFGLEVDGKLVRGTSAGYDTEEEVKIFFYHKLRSELQVSWSTVKYMIGDKVKVFHAKMKEIEDKIVPAVVKEYGEIFGPLEDVNQDLIDRLEKELEPEWHKGSENAY